MELWKYEVLFTYLTTRAVHLELSIDMTTDSFLMTLRRFIARRGEPDIIQCGNGSKFVDVEKELKKAVQKVKHHLIAKELTSRNIEWKFIAPIKAWVGGTWKIMVKLTKRSLKTVNNDRPMYKEVLRTFLVEANVNINKR